MAIDIVTRANKGSPLSATDLDQNFIKLVNAIEDLVAGHCHDGVDSRLVLGDGNWDDLDGGVWP